MSNPVIPRGLRSLLSLASVIALMQYVYIPASAQEPLSSSHQDSSIREQSLQTVVIQAYGLNENLMDQPSSISYISPLIFKQFGHVNFSEAINSVPGLRMETRSPQSYRLNIRGSSFQSPFGVRNVTVYYDGIPVTDPGGDTYLNQFVPEDIHSAEIIKGPASSLYGAGTGGAVLLNDPVFSENPDYTPNVRIGTMAGSYGLFQAYGTVQWGDSLHLSRGSVTHNQSDGYRSHTAFDQNTFLYSTRIQQGNNWALGILLHYNNLYYQTPGGLNWKEFQNNPRMSRPKAGIYPSAATSQAAIHQKNALAGVTQTYRISRHLSNESVVYMMYTDLVNPTFRNYEFRKEPHFGARTLLKWSIPMQNVSMHAIGGFEAQQGYFDVKDFGNSSGSPDTLQTDSHINDFSSSAFAQIALGFKYGWSVVAGISANNASVQHLSLYPSPVQGNSRRFRTNFSPRLAFLKKWGTNTAVYADVSNGFSTPTVSELLPSTNVWNASLQAEKGTSYEMGVRSTLFSQRLFMDISAYSMILRQTISQRRDSSGADYYVNAGGTEQNGIESYFVYTPYPVLSRGFGLQNIWVSQTINHFRYKNYLSNGVDYSGKWLPGVPAYNLTIAMNASIFKFATLHIDWNYMSRVALNDANSAFAIAYEVTDVRLSYQHGTGKPVSWNINCSVNNLFNATYSLGDDINAAAGRYYNPASGRSFVLGFALDIPELNHHKP